MRVPLSLAVLLLALAGPAAAAPPPYAEAVHAYADPPTWPPSARRWRPAARAPGSGTEGSTPSLPFPGS